NPTSPCAVADTETVQVTVIRSPDSGVAVAPNLTLCNTDTALDLDTGLTGADIGGTWNDDDATGGLTVNMFNPTGLTTGTYNFTYTVAALGPCPQSQTTISVEVMAAPEAGLAVAIPDICDTEASLDLGSGLTGADAGGTWTDDDGSGGVLSGTGNSNYDATGVVAGTYNFTYTVNPTSPCAVADTETVQVTVIRSPDAGTSSDTDFCMSEAPVDLFTLLGGTPDITGTWSPSMASGTGFFDPAVDAAGDYTYTVSGGRACLDATATISVSLSESPRITNVDIVDFSENNTVTVEVEGAISGTSFGIGDYEYSLDGVIFQSENVFENVPPGNYTLEVRDANGCLPNAFYNAVNVMGASKFFTPNNDGNNDTWHITNLTPEAMANPDDGVTIYDRYGKIVTVLYAYSDGWDGYYNGEALPSSDYWYTVVVLDGSGSPVLKKGNFSLVRR
ncbi:MAG: T9SS type B sorting domain-containing protein, partial [Urechidicola sp.]|nr:T9SS type B sorting domain-containing protein [Urechidicola sp.]